jgi:hypothetical protein
MAQMPDFRAQYQIPMAAVIDSYRQKAVDEQNMRIQNEQMAMQRRAEPINQLTRLASLVHLGQSIASDMVANSTQKQMANARVTYSELLGKGNELVPSETMGQAKLFTNTPTGREYTSVPTNETVPYSTTPEYSKAAEQAFQTAYPEKYAEEKAKLYDPFPDENKNQKDRLENRVFPDGQPRTVKYEAGTDNVYTMDGKLIPPEIARDLIPSYAPVTVMTPEGPALFNRTPGPINTTSKATPVGEKKKEIAQLNQPELDRLEDTKKSFQTDAVYKAAVLKQAELETAESVVNTKNWVADASLLSTSAKSIGKEAGALNENDIQRLTSSPEVARRIKTKISKWKEGVIPEEDRDDFREIIGVLKTKQAEIINNRLEVYTRNAEKQVRNADRDFLKNYIYDTGESSQSSGISPQEEAANFFKGL